MTNFLNYSITMRKGCYVEIEAGENKGRFIFEKFIFRKFVVWLYKVVKVSV